MCMVGNVGFKFVIGQLLDRIGVYRAAFFAQGAILLSVFLFLKNYNETAFCAGALFFGATYSVYMIILPQLLHEFGRERYNPLLSKISSINTLLGAPLNLGIGRLINASGGLTVLWAIWSIVCLTSFMLTLFLQYKATSRAKTASSKYLEKKT